MYFEVCSMQAFSPVRFSSHQTEGSMDPSAHPIQIKAKYIGNVGERERSLMTRRYPWSIPQTLRSRWDLVILRVHAQRNGGMKKTDVVKIYGYRPVQTNPCNCQIASTPLFLVRRYWSLWTSKLISYRTILRNIPTQAACLRCRKATSSPILACSYSSFFFSI